MLSAQEAFKVGFLSRCISDRLSPEAMLTSVKQAVDLLQNAEFTKQALLGESIPGKLWDTGKAVAGNLGLYGGLAALAGPPVLGGLAGYGLAKATDVSDDDVAAIKDREVIEEYKRQEDRLKRQRLIRDTQPKTPTRGRLLM